MEILQKTKDEAVDYSLNSIAYICEEIGPRESGMPAERESQEWLKNQLLSNEWADSAEIEEFRVARHALVGFSKLIGVMLILGALLQFLRFTENPKVILAANIASLSLALLSLVITLSEFLFYIPLIDPLLQNTTSGNLYGKYMPTGEVKRRIIFSGHCDSAYEWTLMKISQNLMVGVLVADIVCLLASIGIFISNLATGSIPLWSVIFSGVSIICYIGLFFVCNFKVVVPGANDNLTGVFASVSVLKCLKESGIRFENTEVDVVLTGSEEAGLRGADAWAKKHKKECVDSGVETCYVDFDTLRDYDFMTIYYRDMTGIVANDPDVVRLIDKACDKVGHNLKHGIVPFGASDAAAISKNGIKAVCIAGQDPKHARYYHNRRDTADNMDRKTFALGVDIALAAAEIFDREGLK